MPAGWVIKTVPPEVASANNNIPTPSYKHSMAGITPEVTVFNKVIFRAGRRGRGLPLDIKPVAPAGGNTAI